VVRLMTDRAALYLPPCPGEQLRQLAVRVSRLLPDRRQSEAFYEERSEVAYELRQLADRLHRAKAT
jgi:hypothetical protein